MANRALEDGITDFSECCSVGLLSCHFISVHGLHFPAFSDKTRQFGFVVWTAWNILNFTYH